MRLLLDTHLVLWAVGLPERLSKELSDLLRDPDHVPVFSAASIWEVAIKHGLGRTDFKVDCNALRRRLTEHGWEELPITARHAAEIGNLPAIHRDPFDRMLVAQAIVERMPFWTADRQVANYPGPVRRMV